MKIENAIELVKEVRQDYIDDRLYYEALTISIEAMGEWLAEINGELEVEE